MSNVDVAGLLTQAQESYPYKTAANKLYPLVSPVADPVLEKVLPCLPNISVQQGQLLEAAGWQPTCCAYVGLCFLTCECTWLLVRKGVW